MGAFRRTWASAVAMVAIGTALGCAGDAPALNEGEPRVEGSAMRAIVLLAPGFG